MPRGLSQFRSRAYRVPSPAGARAGLGPACEAGLRPPGPSGPSREISRLTGKGSPNRFRQGQSDFRSLVVTPALQRLGDLSFLNSRTHQAQQSNEVRAGLGLFHSISPSSPSHREKAQ